MPASSHRRLLSRYTFELGQCVSRKRGEKALRAAAVEQALANRAKSEFLANMSHELRTPLNAIIGFSDLIAGQPALAQGKATEYARHINHAGRHLLNIISDILDVSKIESGTFELERGLYPLRDLIMSSVSLVETRIAEKRQFLSVQAPETLPVVNVDGRRIKQVIINLLSNAHKFTPEGGRIAVTTAVRQDSVTVSVRDSGIGMSPDQIVVALKPFGQINSGRARQHEGTGLGLPIAKALIEQHAGSFRIASAEGEGTSVSITLPLGGPKEHQP